MSDTLAQHTGTTRLEFAEADLESDAGLDRSPRRLQSVLHLASPFPTSQPKDEQELIRPAVQGALHMLRAARRPESTACAHVLHGGGHVWSSALTDGAVYRGRLDPGGFARRHAVCEIEDTCGASRLRFHQRSLGSALLLGQSRIRARPAARPGYRHLGRNHPHVLEREISGFTPTCDALVDVRDVARMHRLAWRRRAERRTLLCTAGSAWMLDIARRSGRNWARPPATCRPGCCRTGS